MILLLIALAVGSVCVGAQDMPVKIPFRAVVGNKDVVCGHAYAQVGTAGSTIRVKDLRFYVHNVRLLDERGIEVPLQLDQASPWQFEDVALLDFENGTFSCANGTPETNTILIGTAPRGVYRSLRFTLGVPFDLNHTDLTEALPPLNFTALAWTWNSGRKFVRIEVSSTESPRGFIFHLGSTGCQPNKQASLPPVLCSQPNRVEVELPEYDPSSSVVLADLAVLFRDSDLNHAERGCMADAENPECIPLLRNLSSFFRANSR